MEIIPTHDVFRVSAEEKRFEEIQAQFPNLDLDLLEQNEFVLVTFGSLSKVQGKRLQK